MSSRTVETAIEELPAPALAALEDASRHTGRPLAVEAAAILESVLPLGGHRIATVTRSYVQQGRMHTAEADAVSGFETALRRVKARVVASHPALVDDPRLADAATLDALSWILDHLTVPDIAAALEEMYEEELREVRS